MTRNDPEPIRHARADGHLTPPTPDWLLVSPECGWCATRGECDCSLYRSVGL